MSSSTNVDLDALLSPVASETVVRDTERQSRTKSIEDDRPFSTIPLSLNDSDNKELVEDRNTSQTASAAVSHGTPTTASPSPQTTTTFPHQASVQELSGTHESLATGHTDETIRDERENFQARLSRVSLKHGDEIAQDTGATKDIDWDFWGSVLKDYPQFARDHSDSLARAIERGIPNELRGMMWQLMSASKDTQLEAAYAELLKQSTPHEKAIMRDLGRTFPHHEYFMEGSGVGQENLFNVLKAYSLHDTAVGYCQGLPFVVAILLLNMPDEEAFCLLVRLMHSYGLRGHFIPEMPGLQLRLFQFERLLEELLPVLHVHFVRQGVKPSMFASQWFLTAFSYRFPLEIVFRIFDSCLATGIEAMFRFSLVLLVKNEDALLNLKFDDILSFLKNHLLDRYRRSALDSNGAKRDEYLVDQFVQDASEIRITPFMLDSYAHEWDEITKARDAHAIEIDALRNTNRLLQAQVKSLEASLLELNEEHCEVARQLVLSRLQNEELEGELVRYKLLYADAMHQNEEVHSSNRLSSNILHG